MSLFNILKGGALGEVIQSIASQAGTTASNVTRATPGGVGGLVGAGILGALLGRNLSGSVVQNAALLGAGAVAWNFYQKWAAGKKAAADNNCAQPQAQTQDSPMQMDATSTLVIRAMVYASRADGKIDATERSRMNSIITSMMPGHDVDSIIANFEKETISPDVLAREVTTPEQGEDLYRLSCMVIDIDHFMERGYLDALGKSLGLAAPRMAELEQEANDAKASLQVK